MENYLSLLTTLIVALLGFLGNRKLNRVQATADEHTTQLATSNGHTIGELVEQNLAPSHDNTAATRTADENFAGRYATHAAVADIEAKDGPGVFVGVDGEHLGGPPGLWFRRVADGELFYQSAPGARLQPAADPGEPVWAEGPPTPTSSRLASMMDHLRSSPAG